MTPEQFSALSNQGYNHIPITRELFADLDTPLSCYIKVARGRYSYLLESANQGGEKWSRYSVVGLPASRVIKVSGNQVVIEHDGEIEDERSCEDPIGFIEDFQSQFRYPNLPGLPIYTGGLVGYFGYDTVRYVEKRLANSAPEDTIGSPDILLMVSNDVIVFDNVKGKIHLISHANPHVEQAYENAQARLDEMALSMQSNVPPEIREPNVGPVVHEADFVSSYGENQFKSDVEKIKDYIVEGDVMQVVLSQRMSIAFESDPLNLYRALRSLNPSP
jgi:anthranilate synthase component 1